MEKNKDTRVIEKSEEVEKKEEVEKSEEVEDIDDSGHLLETKKDILIKSAKEYYYSGNDELDKERFNSAVVLFFKSLVALVDLYIFQQTGETPSSHISRFRISKEKFSNIYDLLDKDFPFYQDSYVQIMTRELAEVIKNDTKIMAEKTKISL